jgi:hypothetical protein
MSSIKHGDRVKDKISQLTGIVIGITEWMYGCRRISVQPEQFKDGMIVDMFCVDEPQLKVLERGVITREAVAPTPRRHGPREDAQPRPQAQTRKEGSE